MKRVMLVFAAVLSLGFGTCVKAADATKAMPAIISYLLSGDKFPKVISVLPKHGSKNVSVNTDVNITFSKPMDTSTFNHNAFRIFDFTSGIQVQFHIFVLSDTKVQFEFDEPLKYNSEHGINILGLVQDKEGNQPQEETHSFFWTEKKQHYERVVVSGKNGIVKDNKTNLWWQDEEYTSAEDTAYNKQREYGKVLKWQSAINYCKSLNYGSYSDWYLPSRDELKSIVDKKYSGPVMNPIFKNARSNLYWSSTTYASNMPGAWVVYFDYGHDGWGGKSYSRYVRCVRAGQ